MVRTKSSHIIFIDYLRIFASLGVVAIHADEVTSSLSNYIGGKSWWLVNWIHSVSALAIPLFIIVSGYLVLGLKRGEITFNKTVRRLVLPYLIWSSFYLLWRYYWIGLEINLERVVTTIFFGMDSHLYFLTVLIVLYVLVLYFKRRIMMFSTTEQFIVAVLLLAVGMVSSWFQYRSPLFNGFYSSVIFFLPGYLGYFLLGMILYKVKIIVNRHWLLLTFMMGSLWVAGLTYLNFTSLNSPFLEYRFGNYFWDPFNPLIIMLAITVFLLVQNLFNEARLPHLTTIAGLTYGAYLVHPMVIDLLDRYAGFAIHQANIDLWLHYGMKVVLTYVLSLAVVWRLGRFSMGRRSIGG